MISLKGNTIQLRALEPDDLDWLFAVENDERFWEVSNTLQTFSKSVLSQYIANSHLDIYTAKQLRFVIEYQNKNVGLIDLFDFDPQHHRAGIGILVLPEFQSKGIASEALKLLIQYSFRQLKLHQLYANITTDNLHSIRLFRRLNFKIIGTKKDWIFTDKHYKDEYILQLIRRENE